MIDLEDKKLPFPSASEEIFSILDYKDFLKFYITKPSFWKSTFTSLPLWWFTSGKLGGGYQYLKRDKVNHPQAYERINAILESFGGKYGFTEKKLSEKCSYEVFYLSFCLLIAN